MTDTTTTIWSPTSCWLLLEELSGTRSEGATERQLDLARRRIATCSAEEIVDHVRIRTVVERFAIRSDRESHDNSLRAAEARRPSLAAMRGQLTRTGSSADHFLATDLSANPGYDLHGYLRTGVDYQSFLAEHGLVHSRDGAFWMWSGPEGGAAWGEAEYAPVGVIAADLALSSSARERAAGLAAIARMQAAYTS